jgi:tripartite-type tricarboxylate transporter receptor subunit TctC
MKKLLAILLASVITSTAIASNQTELTVHHATGGPSDRITRLIAKHLPEQDYMVNNRPGAAGRIAVKHVLGGNAILTATVSQIYVTNPLMFKDLEYNPTNDLEIIATVATLPNLLICNAKHGFSNFQDFAKSTKSLSFAINGYGSSEHIASEALFVHTTGKHLVIPYPAGGNKGALDVLAGNVDCTFGNYAGIRPFINDPRINVLFASHDMGDKILTWETQFKEPYPYQSYVSLVVARSMDPALKKKIIADLNKVFANPEFKEITFKTGLLPIGSTEAWMTNSVLKSNRALERFIQNNNLKIKQ